MSFIYIYIYIYTYIYIAVRVPRVTFVVPHITAENLQSTSPTDAHCIHSDN